LEFRIWRSEDIALAGRLWGDPQVTALIDARGVLDQGAIEERLLTEIRLQKNYGIQYWPIFLIESGAFAGCAGVRPRDLDQRVYELGFHICSDSWGKGLATEAARAVITFAFGPLGATALFAGHNPRNEASARVLSKLGFRHTHDELYPPTGLQHPSYLLRPEDLSSETLRNPS